MKSGFAPALFLFALALSPLIAKERVQPVAPSEELLPLTEAEGSRFASLALRCVEREYPNKLDHVMNGPEEVKGPKALHPSFYGCFDWHSSVHGHWMLVRLLRTFPALPEAPQIRLALRGNLKAENIAQEVAYLSQKERQSFERTYGWAWLLKLAQELRGWDDPDGREWSKNLQPLADAIVDRFKSFLPRQTYPIRTGVHPNTAFALAFAFDYARSCGDKGLEELVVRRSKEYYLSDTLYPAVWEPGGEDFFSPALMEADLMARVLGPAEFHRWFHRFLPEISKKGAPRLLSPATVSDRHDPKIVHLDGLNLSRAWCMAHIASVLPKNDPVRPLLIKSAAAHRKDALANIQSGSYVGEHWLASFAVYLTTEPFSLKERGSKP